MTEESGSAALIEPVTSLLRVPGEIADADFLDRLCARANCRVLVDVTTLLVASRNHQFDPRSWLAGLDGGLIAAARIGGCAFRGGRWHRDAAGPIDDAAWSLLHDLAGKTRPDVLILEAAPPTITADDVARGLLRLRQLDSPTAVVRPAGAAARPDATPPRPARTPPRIVAAAAEPAIDRIEAAPDVSFFVLDDEGVLLSESRQELSLFNTSAALLWCLLEDATPVDEMIAAYQHAAGVPQAQASRDVGSTLRRWFGLGYTTTPFAAAPDVPLTTALAQVLTNAGLRAQFGRSPARVAADLGVDAEDEDCFVRLDPDELDAQAAEFERLQSLWRTRPSRWSIDDGGAAAATEVAPARERCYRLAGTILAVRSADEVVSRVHESLAHLHVPAGPPQLTLDVRATEPGGWTVWDSQGPYRECRSLDEVVPAVMEILRALVNREPSLLKIHAGVASFGSGCVLLPAAAGSGKTTLTAGLIHAGATYYSDEIAILDAATLRVMPVPLPLSIKDGSLAPLKRLFPGVEALTAHVREDYQRVRYLPPPAGSLASERGETVRWLVFPRFDPRGGTTLAPLTRADGFRRLLAESLVLPERLDRTMVASLVQWLRDVECFELSVSSLDSAVDTLRELMLGPAPPPSTPG